MRRTVAFIFAGALALAPLTVGADTACEWAEYGNGPAHTFAQTDGCSSITPVSVGALTPKWYVETGTPVTASPAVADDTVFVGANTGTFYALNAADGSVRWTFQVDDDNQTGFGAIVSSAAVPVVDGTRVVLFGGGATLYMLDAATGAVIDRLCTDPRAPSATRCAGSSSDIEIQTSPAIARMPNGQTWVVFGMDVHNRRNVGRTGVIAARVTATSLTPLWKFDPENRQTYTGADLLTTGHGTGDGCGGVWSSPAVDVVGDMVFFGTASCSTGSLATGPWAGESMFGIRLSTGAFAWQYNPRVDRGESTRLDDDFGASANLLPGGLVGAGSKDGWYYGLKRDRADLNTIAAGEWATRAGQAGHAGGDFAIGGMIGTAAVGTSNGAPTIFATTAISTPFNEGTNGPDMTLATDPGRMFSIHAIDAATGAITWRSPLSRQSYGAPTYANGLVFVPSTVDFAINIFHADTGVLLRRVPVNGAPSSAPALVGDSLYMGTGTSVDPFPFDDLSGIWAFSTAL